MKVLVCGSRDWSDNSFFRFVLSGIRRDAVDRGDILTIVHGACPTGADAMAEDFADPTDVERYPADWERLGRAAGPLRNQQMLDEGLPDMVVAFINKPLEGSRGTFDMVRRARAAGVPVYVIRGG